MLENKKNHLLKSTTWSCIIIFIVSSFIQTASCFCVFFLGMDAILSCTPVELSHNQYISVLFVKEVSLEPIHPCSRIYTVYTPLCAKMVSCYSPFSVRALWWSYPGVAMFPWHETLLCVQLIDGAGPVGPCWSIGSNIRPDRNWLRQPGTFLLQVTPHIHGAAANNQGDPMRAFGGKMLAGGGWGFS